MSEAPARNPLRRAGILVSSVLLALYGVAWLYAEFVHAGPVAGNGALVAQLQERFE